MNHPLLFDQSPDMFLVSAGQRRTRIGQIIEELACCLFDLEPVGRGSEVFVPDARQKLDEKLPVEIKASKCGDSLKGRSILYDWRMDKERDLAPRLAYIFMLHNTKGSPHPTLGGFLDSMAQRQQIALVVPGFLVHDWAKHMAPLKKHKSSEKDGKRYGYTRAGYADGYRELALEPFIKASNYTTTATILKWNREFTFSILHHPAGAWTPMSAFLLSKYGPPNKSTKYK